MKIAVIGAGSIVFCKTLITDLLLTPGLGKLEFALMAPSTRRTTQVEHYVNALIAARRADATVWKTTDQREALRNADYVIACFQIGGVTAFEMDYSIPMKYGVDNCIGDTLGPGGIFRALRTIPVMNRLAADMKELCPGALLLNYVNPMAMIGWALGKTGVKFVGLCHGVQTTLDLLAGYAGVPKEEIDFTCAGINHMSWFLEFKHRGVDLYPRLRACFEKPEYYVNEKVRGEVFRHFGYFMTESTGHLSEYLPYFRKNEEVLRRYCDEPAFGGESGAYYRYSRYVAEKYSGDLKLDPAEIDRVSRSVEYCSYIIEALETGRIFKFFGNVRNNGMIADFPEECCAEGAIYADRTGLHPGVVGHLPGICAALNLSNIAVQKLAVEAANSGDPELVVQACAIDPLTAAKLSLREIREMATEMMEAERQWLPQFGDRRPRPVPDIVIPPDVQRAPVPVDPALAILARLGELGK